jgi:ABC-type multidrug transport system ATPase subunit
MIIISKGETIIQGSVKELLNAQELIVWFGVNDVAKAKTILSTTAFANTVDVNANQHLLLHTSHESIAIINKLLCDGGVQVSSIETKRKLEDYFLKLISPTLN